MDQNASVNSKFSPEHIYIYIYIYMPLNPLAFSKGRTFSKISARELPHSKEHENVAESTMEISLKLVKLVKTISTGYILPII